MTRTTVSDSPIDGFLLLDKPAGLTSQQAVSRVKRALGVRKAGHAGTLDPMATGLLMIGLGKATRLLGYLSDKDKQYEATIRLGMRTTTDDAEGEPVGQPRDASGISAGTILAAMSRYVGEIQQVPSSVSAIKVDGKRAYALVRAGEEVTLTPRTVTVTKYDLVSRTDWRGANRGFEPSQTPIRAPQPGSPERSHPILAAAGLPAPGYVDLNVVVDCSSGTYIRALARDLGEDLGVGGHLVRLRRTRIGKLSVDDAVGLDDVSPDAVIDMGSVAGLIAPRVEVPPERVADIAVGRPVPLALDDDLVTVFCGNNLLALYRPDPADPSLARPAAVFIGAEDVGKMTNGHRDGMQ